MMCNNYGDMHTCSAKEELEGRAEAQLAMQCMYCQHSNLETLSGRVGMRNLTHLAGTPQEDEGEKIPNLTCSFPGK